MIRPAKLALFALLLFITGPLRAADDKAQPPATQVYAVIVGAGEFKDTQLKPRTTAESDAKALYDVLTDKTVGGVAADHVELLLTGKEDAKRNSKAATKKNVNDAIKSVAEKATANDRILFIWIGTGAAAGDRTCLFTADSTFKDRAKDALSPTELEANWKSVKAKEVLAVLDLDLKAIDAGKEPVLEPNVMDLVRVFLGVKDKDEAEPPAGRAVLLAGSGTNPVVTVDGKEGIFTKAVIAGLRARPTKMAMSPMGLSRSMS